MVTVTNYLTRESSDGKKFFVLEISGDVEMVFSETTGKPYATIRKTTIPATFDELTCKRLIGKELPGTIEKAETENYDFTVKDTGEVISLNHSYVYNPKETNQTMEQAVFQKELAAAY